MKIAVTGATGFIGSRLSEVARSRGHEVIPLSRSAEGARRWDPLREPAPLEGAEAVVHLAGDPVARRWTKRRMAAIRESRVVGTRNLVEGLRKASPRVLVSASAIGYYGDRGEEELAEDSPPGGDFLAEVCKEWEAESLKAGVRTVLVRIGIVLGPGGGALRKMLTPFKLGLGGRLGSGDQWMSWVHRDDLVSLFLHAVEQEGLSGPVLGTAPHPVRNIEFTKTLGRVLGRWTILPMPGWQAKLLFGKMSAILLGSQKCRSRRAAESGFSFAYPDLEPALRQVLSP